MYFSRWITLALAFVFSLYLAKPLILQTAYKSLIDLLDSFRILDNDLVCHQKHYYPNMTKSSAFLAALSSRRSYYSLNSSSSISSAAIKAIVQKSLEVVPSAFNSQTTRAVLLLGEEHKELWQLNARIAEKAKEKMKGFEAGAGTVLFFEDMKVVQSFKEKFKLYEGQFGDWSHHTSAMHQYAVWTALELEGFGANLQHYNPLVDDGVKEKWKLPKDWKLISQLVFGTPVQPPAKKKAEHDTAVGMEEKLRVFE